MGITHSTAADGTFSSTGATAWNAEHTLTESGGQALTVGSIADNEFVKRSGTSLIGATPSGNTDILAAAAPNSDFDLTNGGAGGAVTILSKSITGIAVGDQIQVDFVITIFNNSGGAVTYSRTAALGALSSGAIADATTLAASATNRSYRRDAATFSISATNLAYVVANGVGGAAAAAGAAATISGTFDRFVWQSSSSDLTGTQTLTIQYSSSSTTTTQTLILHAYTIRKISSNP